MGADMRLLGVLGAGLAATGMIWISGVSSQVSADVEGDFSLSPTRLSLGRHPAHTELQHRIVLRNATDHWAEVVDYEVSCGCTSIRFAGVELAREAVAAAPIRLQPRSELQVEMKLRAPHAAKGFSVRFDCEVEGRNESLVAEFDVEGYRPVWSDTDFVEVRATGLGDRVPFAVNLDVADGEDLELLEVLTTGPVEDVVVTRRGDDYRLCGSVVAALWGENAGRLDLQWSRDTSLSIATCCRIEPPFATASGIVSLGVLRAGDGVSRAVELEVRDQAAQVTSVRHVIARDGDTELGVELTESGLLLAAEPMRAGTVLRGHIELMIDGARPPICLPLSGFVR